jgi:hypothetical protein
MDNPINSFSYDCDGNLADNMSIHTGDRSAGLKAIPQEILFGITKQRRVDSHIFIIGL